MSSEPPAISARGLTKAYQIYHKPIDRLKQMIWHGRRTYYRQFLAVRNVDLDVHRGETVGIVGRNGSGKSTLLKMICGTLLPTSGTIEVHGRMAPMLALGAGFNGEFSGRENVMLNATIFGMSEEEINECYPKIVEFADIGDFIDHPVKLYSSGMTARLAFAVAIHLKPDVLVIDEILAVGDDAFKRKCAERIERIKERGATILFVSHSAQKVIELCDRAILLEAGERLMTSDPKTIITQYHRLLYCKHHQLDRIRASIRACEAEEARQEISGDVGDGDNVGKAAPSAAPAPDTPERWAPTLKPESTVAYESKGARIHDVQILSKDGRRVNIVGPRSRVAYTYFVTFDQRCTVDHFGMLIKSTTGLPLCGLIQRPAGDHTTKEYAAGTMVRVTFDLEVRLKNGTYFFNAGVYGFAGGEATYLHRIVDAEIMRVEHAGQTITTSYVDLSEDPNRIGTIEHVNAADDGMIPATRRRRAERPRVPA